VTAPAAPRAAGGRGHGNYVGTYSHDAGIKRFLPPTNYAHASALNDYVAFVVTKSFGLTAMITGIIEIVNPDFHPVKLLPAESVVAFGLALLTGSGIIRFLSKIAEALK
jgi:hypothetical protein